MQRDVVGGPRPWTSSSLCPKSFPLRSSCTCRRDTVRWVRATVVVTGWQRRRGWEGRWGWDGRQGWDGR